MSLFKSLRPKRQTSFLEMREAHDAFQKGVGAGNKEVEDEKVEEEEEDEELEEEDETVELKTK